MTSVSPALLLEPLGRSVSMPGPGYRKRQNKPQWSTPPHPSSQGDKTVALSNTQGVASIPSIDESVAENLNSAATEDWIAVVKWLSEICGLPDLDTKKGLRKAYNDFEAHYFWLEALYTQVEKFTMIRVGIIGLYTKMCRDHLLMERLIERGAYLIILQWYEALGLLRSALADAEIYMSEFAADTNGMDMTYMNLRTNSEGLRRLRQARRELLPDNTSQIFTHNLRQAIVQNYKESIQRFSGVIENMASESPSSPLLSTEESLNTLTAWLNTVNLNDEPLVAGGISQAMAEKARPRVIVPDEERLKLGRCELV
ncbi:hypothetical protein NP233_g12391 [Leucocoprinus birnbaumii]|uniref:Uncharacterized protein n=1 Tax=Leucocoprinus birnbaumii TaxID=56174 RepID=A0AAD5VH35_9AGAR|nr:hypothetical protein NP233_g12391 [Leucocoprinus birnbaumii]